jgi:type IV secretory pathway VirB10-like protein
MEALILAIILTYAIKKAAEDAHLHWQSSKAANRKASKGKPVRKRAASAVQHDAGYWAHQVLNGFPQVRRGLSAGWQAGRTAQAQGAAERRKARTEHLERQVRLTAEIRDHLRRQEQAMDAIRAARQPEPDLSPAGVPPDDAPAQAAAAGPLSPPGGDNGTAPVTPPTTEGTPAMSGDTTYTQQMTELEAIRRDAEEASAAVARKRMTSRLDILQSMGLDNDSLSEAAAIDDALQDLEKAVQKLTEAADTAIAGLSKRHGGIKAAVDDAPVDKPADAPFYQD